MRRNLILISLLAIMLPAMAASTAENLYYANFPDLLASFDETTDGVEKAFYYAIEDLDGDGVKEFVLADVKKTKCVYKAVGNEVHLISPDYTIVNDSLSWDTVDNFYVLTQADRSGDITLRHHPMFAYDIDIAHNRFTVPGDVTWDEQVMRSTVYDRLVFKPHVGNLHLNYAKPDSYDSDGTKIELGMCYTYGLDDASATKKMFRGYKNDQAVPVVVPHAWLENHNPLQYTRWLSGEPERKVGADARRIIEEYFAFGSKIRQIKWLAGCETAERSFYWVIFEPREGKVLVAMVCIAEGFVASTRAMWFDQAEGDPDAIDFGPDIDDLEWLAPEIMVMAATPAGLELYVRWHSFEGSHYDIWREVADQFVTIQSDYHYIMAY